MRAVKPYGSKIEIMLAKAIFARGFRYRKNDRTVYGNPDLTFKKKKVAIFVDSEFWHGRYWPEAKLTFKSNQAFWISKIERNIERDRIVNQMLTDQGWTVIRFWGKEIICNLKNCVSIVIDRLNQ